MNTLELYELEQLLREIFDETEGMKLQHLGKPIIPSTATIILCRPSFSPFNQTWVFQLQFLVSSFIKINSCQCVVNMDSLAERALSEQNKNTTRSQAHLPGDGTFFQVLR